MFFFFLDADPMNPSEEGGSYDSDSGASSSSSSPPSPPPPPSQFHLNHHHAVQPHLPPQPPNSTISPPPLPLLPAPLQHTSPPLLPLNHHQSILGKVQLPTYLAEKLPLLTTNNLLMQENNHRMLLQESEMKQRDHHHHQHHHRSPSSSSPTNHPSPPVYIPEDVILPPEFELQESCIQEAGLGVFSLVDILQGRKFGPFTGVEKSSVTDTQYAWEVSFQIIS